MGPKSGSPFMTNEDAATSVNSFAVQQPLFKRTEKTSHVLRSFARLRGKKLFTRTDDDETLRKRS